jgi:hypothetical protein
MPAQAVQVDQEAEFLAQFAVFKPQDTPEQCLIEGIRLQITANPHFWLVLEQCYGNLGVVPGTGAIVREFYYVHYLAHKYLR